MSASPPRQPSRHPGRTTREESARWHLIRILATLDSVHRYRGKHPAGYERALSELKRYSTQARIALRRSKLTDRLTLNVYRYDTHARKRAQSLLRNRPPINGDVHA